MTDKAFDIKFEARDNFVFMKVSQHVPGGTRSWEFRATDECSEPFMADLLAHHLNQRMGIELFCIRSASYADGYNDRALCREGRYVFNKEWS